MQIQCLKCLKSLGSEKQHYGLHLECFYTWFEVTEPFEFTGVVRKASSRDPAQEEDQLHLSENNKNNSSFFLGKFRKYSAELNGESYILKVREAEAPELPDGEYICNQIGEAVGIPVAKFYCIYYLGERTFVTKNFVDKKRNTNLSHIYHHKPEREPRNCEILISVISDETKRFLDVDTFVNTCLFDSLIGNHDRHGRNMGFLVTPKGNALSPIYDNPSALGLEKGEWLNVAFNPPGRIPTSNNRNPTMKDYVIEFIRLGYEEKILEFYKRIDKSVLIKIINNGFCSELMKNALIKLLSNRIEELENAIQARS